MRSILAGMAGGLAAGALTSGVAAFGRESGTLHKTMAENARDWLQQNTSSPPPGPVAEHGSHFGMAALLGGLYGLTRPLTRFIPAPIMGALFGAGLYYTNAAAIAPAIGMTEGEDKADKKISYERLAVHVGFGVVTALVAAALAERSHDDDDD